MGKKCEHNEKQQQAEVNWREHFTVLNTKTHAPERQGKPIYLAFRL